jgi:hypothetical protein
VFLPAIIHDELLLAAARNDPDFEQVYLLAAILAFAPVQGGTAVPGSVFDRNGLNLSPGDTAGRFAAARAWHINESRRG